MTYLYILSNIVLEFTIGPFINSIRIIEKKYIKK